MKRSTLRSSTALAMSALLAVPAPVFAAGHIPNCGDPVEPICLAEDGTLLVPAPGDQLQSCEEAGPPCRVEPGLVRLEVDSPRAQNALAAAGMTDAEAETEMADGDATAEVEGDTEMAEGGDAEAAETETEMADGDATAEVEVEGDAEVEAVADGLAADSGETEMAAEEDASAGAETDMAEEEAPTEADVPQIEEQAAEETTESTGDEGVVADADEGVESAPAAGGESVAAEAAAETEAPATAAAAAAEGDAEANVEVATEDVTEDTARSSDEDFETAAVGDTAAGSATAAEGGTAAGSGDSGLSNFEKALLIGLGAVAVGSVLNNGDEVVSNSGDRVVVRRNGELQVLKDDDALLRQPGAQVRTETFEDGSTRTTVTRQDGTKIVTIRSADGRVLRRARVFEDGSQVVLFDDTAEVAPVDLASLPEVEEEAESISLADADEEALRRALEAAMVRDTGRTYSLRQIRQIREVRQLAPEIELDAITFSTGSAAIQPSQAEELTALGRAMRDIIQDNPGEVFLVEGHTDTVGDATLNLALSDRRAETVALALAEYFDVPPENMVTQGYGESQLKIRQEGGIRANRRATVRRITPLLTASN